jgi:hypothetical protein
VTAAAAPAQSTSWRRHPVAATALRVAILAAPVAASVAVTAVASRLLPPERVGLPPLPWWFLMLAAATGALLGVERLARQLLPLAALLRLSLVFPDRAPSRFSLALRTGTTKQLERRITAIRAGGMLDGDARLAAQMLELVAALNVHDRLTRGHCERVRAYTDLIIEELGLDPDDANRLRWAALVHDVGKLFVPAEILNSPDRPTPEQWDVLKSHTWRGQQLVAPLQDFLGPWGLAVGQHHERWDGGGYPVGLAGEEIHLGARIVAVADAFDVMTSTRSYKKPMPAEAARQELVRCSGTQFDPEIVRAFLAVGLGRLRLILGPAAWIVTLPLFNRPGGVPTAELAGTPVMGTTTLSAVTASSVPAVAGSALSAVAAAAIAVGTGGLGGLAPAQADVAAALPVVAVAQAETDTDPTGAPDDPAPGEPSPGPEPADEPAPDGEVPDPVDELPLPPTPVEPTPPAPVAPLPPAPAVPELGPDTFTLDEDTTITITAAQLLANDGHPQGRSLEVRTVSAPGLGQATVAPAADPAGVGLTWTPPADWHGTTGTTYVACVVGTSTCATGDINLVVAPANDRPVLALPPGPVIDVTRPVDIVLEATDADGDPLSWSATGLPPGLSLGAATGRITGTVAVGGDGSYPVTVTVSDPDGATATGAVTFTVHEWLPSGLVGTVAITEVLTVPSSPFWNDEFVEITNLGSAPFDLAGLRLVDFNLRRGGPDALAPRVDLTFPATDRHGRPSVLAPGQAAVVWVIPQPGSADVWLDYALPTTWGTPDPMTLRLWGDDLWLLDPQLRVIDYLAWGEHDQISPRPDPLVIAWDTTYELSLQSVASGQSLSLASPGPRGTSACWEPTGSGAAAGRCPDARPTVGTDTYPKASPGRRNWV